MNEPRFAAQPTPVVRAAGMARVAALLASFMLGLLVVSPALAASQAFPAPQTLAPACAGVNLRTAASPRASIKVKLALASHLTVTGTVSGSSWGTKCPAWKSGASWYKVTHVNGRSVRTLYGVAALYAATGVLTRPAGGALPAPAATAATPAPAALPTPAPEAPIAPVGPVVPAAADGITYRPACDGINLRTAASTSATIKVKLGLGSTVTAPLSVTGPSWATTCPTAKSGSSWHVISEVNGQAVNAIYGVPFLFAATGVLVPASATGSSSPVGPSPATPAPAVAPAIAPALVPAAPGTAAPPPAATAAPPQATPTTPSLPVPAADSVLVTACGGVNLRTSASTSATIKVKLAVATSVAVSGTVAGSSWSTSCPTSKSGSSWYVVTQLNGQAVGALYGVPALFAASGVLVPPAGGPVTGAVLPTPAPSPATAPSGVVTTASTVLTASSVTTLGPSTTFYGRGYGHGVGMSQYGARGRALAGQLAPEILAHYYAGTTIGSISPDAAIRVLLLDNFAPTAVKPLIVYGRGGPWTFADLGTEFPADARLQLLPPASAIEPWRALVDLAGTQVLYDGPVPLDFRVRGTTDGSTIQLFSKPSTWDLFRGTLRVIVAGGSVDVVNELPLETYLRGVVPAEMPTSWPVEARIAQTIVARSYAAYQRRSASSTFDVYDDTRSQVYLGARQEKPDADAVIAATAGQVLLSGSSIANALFHSTAGGATENNENVFVSATGARVATPVGYLRGSSDRDPAGVSYDAGAPTAAWQTRAYSIAELSALFARDSRTNVGTLTGLDLRNRGVSGRLISVTLIGSLGTRTVSGTVFVAAFNAGRASTDAAIRGTLLDVAPIP